MIGGNTADLRRVGKGGAVRSDRSFTLYSDKGNFYSDLNAARNENMSELHEEGRPPESVFDFVQGITALARGKAHQDARLELERKAKSLLEHGT